MAKRNFEFGSAQLSVLKALDLAQGKCDAILVGKARQRVAASAKAVAKIVERGEVVYGVNTGFGPLCSTVISAGETRRLQENILRSHSVGTGEPVADEIVRLMLVLKAQSLAQGYSGVQPETIDRILLFLKKNILPIVPSQGSVGASGDLAPLAHLFLPLIGEGQVKLAGKTVPAGKALQKLGLKPLTLGPKEGLALINGTQFILAHAVQVTARLHNALETADVVGALTLEALLGSSAPFEQAFHNLRPYAGAKLVAKRLSRLLKNSEMVASHHDCDRVQDPYSLRCMPQVHGASRSAWQHLRGQVEIELNSVTDNPIIFDADHTVSGGHFHGQPLALPLDYAALAASELGNISDRRTYLLLEGREGLPKLLMKDTGVNSGFMMPQYTSAALASENKSLCFPASADSIPTSLGQEDHVSMGSISGRKALRILDNLDGILAVELLCAAQAFDYRRPLKSSPILEACHKLVRQKISHTEKDRVFADDINLARELIASGDLVRTVDAAAKRFGGVLNGDQDDFILS